MPTQSQIANSSSGQYDANSSCWRSSRKPFSSGPTLSCPRLNAGRICWLAATLGRPVKWVEARSENLVCHGHARAQRQQATIGGRRDGTLIGYRLEITADAGAYPRVGAGLPGVTVDMAAGPYAFTRVAAAARSVVTNTAPVGAYRGSDITRTGRRVA